MNGSVNFEDVEFLAEDEMLKVTPKFREGRLQMITGNFGPFTPGVPLQVPVWMAINLGKYQNYGVFLIQQPVNCECGYFECYEIFKMKNALFCGLLKKFGSP